MEAEARNRPGGLADAVTAVIAAQRLSQTTRAVRNAEEEPKPKPGSLAGAVLSLLEPSPPKAREAVEDDGAGAIPSHMNAMEPPRPSIATTPPISRVPDRLSTSGSAPMESRSTPVGSPEEEVGAEEGAFAPPLPNATPGDPCIAQSRRAAEVVAMTTPSFMDNSAPRPPPEDCPDTPDTLTPSQRRLEDAPPEEPPPEVSISLSSESLDEQLSTLTEATQLICEDDIICDEYLPAWAGGAYDNMFEGGASPPLRVSARDSDQWRVVGGVVTMDSVEASTTASRGSNCSSAKSLRRPPDRGRSPDVGEIPQDIGRPLDLGQMFSKYIDDDDDAPPPPRVMPPPQRPENVSTQARAELNPSGVPEVELRGGVDIQNGVPEVQVDLRSQQFQWLMTAEQTYEQEHLPLDLKLKLDHKPSGTPLALKRARQKTASELGV